MDPGREHPSRPESTPFDALQPYRGHRAIWPLLCILIGLLVLGVTSPRLWERADRRRGRPAAASRDDAALPPTDAAEPAALVLPRDVPEPTRDPPLVSISISERTSIPTEEPFDGAKPLDRPSLPDVPIVDQPAPPDPAAEPVEQQPSEPAAPSPPAEIMPIQVARPAAAPEGPSLWPEPQALVERLDELAVDCDTGEWAMEVQQALRRLGSAMNQNRHEAAAALVGRLAELQQEADGLAGRLEDPVLSSKVLRAAYALDRRLPIWSAAVAAGGLRAPAGEVVRGSASRLSACLAAVDALTRGKPQGPAWSQYLTLQSLRELADGRIADEDRARAVAKAVLQRLAHVPLNPRQRQFLAERPMAALRTELCRWTAAPVEFRGLLEDLERYEETGSASAARSLADHCRRLVLASSAHERQLGGFLDSHYRNANVRLAVSGWLLDQLIPERPDQCQDVDDVIGGRPVHGQSLTSADVTLRLIPDRQRVRMALEIEGQVAALTHSDSGPATFYNDTESVYRARKEIEIGPRGMVLRPAQVEVQSELRLRDVSTQLDPIPLVGALAQGVARSQHESRRCELSAEVEQKVWAQAKEQIDGEAEARLGRLARRLEQTLFEPLACLSLGPDLISAETTGLRAVVRLRLASYEQLGSHTPRPRAPAGSLASVQVHQSALNNVVEQLQLDGATLALPELRRRVAERLGRPEWLRGETDNDDVIVAFAPRDAVRIELRDGRVVLSLSIARLEKEPRAWEDFQVRVCYGPQAKGRWAELVREEVIELVGEDLNSRSRIALQGIFAKTFPRQRTLPLVPERIGKDPRLNGLRVTQVAIDDGWFAMAFGPAPSGLKPPSGKARPSPRVATRGLSTPDSSDP